MPGGPGREVEELGRVSLCLTRNSSGSVKTSRLVQCELETERNDGLAAC